MALKPNWIIYTKPNQIVQELPNHLDQTISWNRTEPFNHLAFKNGRFQERVTLVETKTSKLGSDVCEHT